MANNARQDLTINVKGKFLLIGVADGFATDNTADSSYRVKIIK